MVYLVNNKVEIERLFRLVSDTLKALYAPFGTVTITIKDIALGDIRWSARILSHSRLNNSRVFIEQLNNSTIALFPFCFYVTPEGLCHAITPPIVEAYYADDGVLRYLLLDGSHRCYAAIPADSNRNISVLVVSFISEPKPLPCAPLPLSSISVLDIQPPLKDLFVDLSEENFRPVRQLTHKRLRFSSLSIALASVRIGRQALTSLKEINL